jgi:hypothetical protein
VPEDGDASRDQFGFEYSKRGAEHVHEIACGAQVKFAKKNERRAVGGLCGKNCPEVRVRRYDNSVLNGRSPKDVFIDGVAHTVIANVDGVMACFQEKRR